MLGISACLVGKPCTYRGDDNEIPVIKELYKKEGAILVCPEVLGGLPIPRAPSEIVSEEPLCIMTIDGRDVTDAFVKGAQMACDMFTAADVDTAILKANSPSCGVGSVYDGTFSHRCIAHDGIFARLLRQKGITLLTEYDYLKGRSFE